ncbi:tetratricopeptide repeat protein [Mucilaginibacter litoreus]|uniref:histidine kinase n=1 Tax=Mucilaginibacter litoreus TaxID=1048221 RepID=A0ABW3ATR4_9SPHI
MNFPTRILINVVFNIVWCLTALLSFNLVAKAKEPSSSADTIEFYNKLVSRYRYDKPDSAVFFANIGLKLAKQLKDFTGQAIMLNQLGMIDDNIGDFESSRKKYIKALSLYKRTGNTKGMATENIRLGVVEMRKGEYDKSIGYFLQALDISQHNGNKAGQMEAYITLGEAYAGQKKHDKALAYYQIAENLNNHLPFTNLSLNLFNDIAISYRETGKLNEAKPYLFKGIGLSNTPQYQGLNITLINTLASVYAKAGEQQTSIKLQELALKKARKINNYIRQIQTLTGLATTYGSINTKKSLYYWQEALKLSQSRQAYKEQVDELNAIAELHEKEKNFKAAYDTRTRQFHIADEFFYKKMSKQIVNLQNAYELNQSKAREQELRFANNKQILEQRISYGIIAAALIILVVVIVYYFRLRKLNLLLNKTNADLRESNTVKDKLFSVLGHDLRSPFISVINLLEIIDDDIEPEQRKALLDQLNMNARVSLETLDSLLRWGQKQIKGIPINPSRFNAKSVIDKAAVFLSAVAENKLITIINTVGSHIEVLADVDHFEFIIRNLLSNAIKFSSNNSTVYVNAVLMADKKVAVSVKDSGIGIAGEKLSEIFDINNTSTRGTGNEKGTGLGLLLSKEFAEANGGTVTVKSELGKGSEFTVILQSV